MSPRMVNPKQNALVKKDEVLVYARYELSETALKVLSTVISMIRTDDRDFQIYVLRVQDFKELSDYKGKALYDYLKEVCEELQKRPLHIPRNHGGFLICNWFSSAEYIEKSGEIEFSFDPKLKPYLLELKERFLGYEIQNILKLRSTYIIKLYELLKHEYNKNSYGKSKVDFEINIQELRNVFRIPDSYQYNDIRRFILDKAQQQFIENTDIKFLYTERKRGRAVDSIEFEIFENTCQVYLRDEKSFIDFMRKKLVNYDILTTTDKYTNKPLILSISQKGNLYNKLDATEDFTPVRAKEIWSGLYKLALENKLPCLVAVNEFKI